ncbi:UbiH/UbiF/VisC/COQ6 family ubiquinone biosynthesis hydroxylase [Acidihalobacter ferrooxydans]|uniref:2-octaprenyl-3-methyl-6-methoxy-1,4-benzoquinol hydroxylase n=1 Tax=Acidihalobacter ferrooxydans TaxID=1765967 RepID=A0A1P8UIW4_9GAMM|nr:UbiH/UbiF/VisC/COQ6 family ubiquinone biosynthesis hydroxylase [Acidihalobacter ferrooxydans]APZ43711.1 2-octaprenyl-3-methyl-6-methoxy-1,4-benzoquinol hydroxylase [Acidihalobacter ferrooxydans]
MAAQLREFDIVIVGGGMVGAALAVALALAGRNVAVVEARLPDAWQVDEDYDLRVSAINRASQNLLSRLGVWPGIVSRRANPYRRMVVWDARSTGEIAFDAVELGEPDLGHIVENRVIQHALLERLAQLDGVQLFAPQSVETLEIGPQTAQLTLSDGTRLGARLVVGADGARSRVCELAGMRRSVRKYGQTALVATVATDASHADTAWQRFLPTGPLAFLPLGDGRSSIVWSATTAQAERLLGLDDDAFRAELSRAFDLRLGCVTACSERAAFALIGGQAYPYVQPRVALIGDAAHSIHPLAGQGVNLGFMDAAELAGVLAATGRDPGALAVLRRYERARRGENEAVMRLMESFRVLFGSGLPMLPWLRGRGMRLVGGLTPVKRQVMLHALGTAGQRPELATTPLDQTR